MPDVARRPTHSPAKRHPYGQMEYSAWVIRKLHARHIASLGLGTQVSDTEAAAVTASYQLFA